MSGKRKHRVACAIVTLAMLLCVVMVPMCWPHPAPLPMMFARTVVTPVVQGYVPGEMREQSTLAYASDFSVTTDASTTAAVRLYGLVPLQIINESGASATLTLYNSLTVDGTALAPYDEDGVAIASITIADDCSRQLPSALWGCSYLVIKGAAAGDHFTLTCRR